MAVGGKGGILLHWPPKLGGELGGDARPSRDPELQSDAAFGAVVTRVWLPAPRCPELGGLASGPGKSGAGKGPGACAPRPCQQRLTDPGNGRRTAQGSPPVFSTLQHAWEHRGPQGWGSRGGWVSRGGRATKSDGKPPPSPCRKTGNTAGGGAAEGGVGAGGGRRGALAARGARAQGRERAGGGWSSLACRCSSPHSPHPGPTAGLRG